MMVTSRRGEMDCREAKRKVLSFIQSKMDLDTMEEFLSHIQKCHGCYKELEIYFMIWEGLKKDGNINLTAELEEYIRNSYHRIHIRFIWRVFRYALNTLVILSVILSFFLQLRLWYRG